MFDSLHREVLITKDNTQYILEYHQAKEKWQVFIYYDQGQNDFENDYYVVPTIPEKLEDFDDYIAAREYMHDTARHHVNECNRFENMPQLDDVVERRDIDTQKDLKDLDI
jgi:hypothetical protein